MGVVGQAAPLWGWPDALFGGLLAVCLPALWIVSTVRSRRVRIPGAVVAATLVLALAGAVATHSLPAVRLVGGAVVVVALGAAAVIRLRRRAVRVPNAIAPVIRR